MIGTEPSAAETARSRPPSRRVGFLCLAHADDAFAGAVQRGVGRGYRFIRRSRRPEIYLAKNETDPNALTLDEKLKSKIRACGTLVVLISTNNVNRPIVNEEIRYWFDDLGRSAQDVVLIHKDGTLRWGDDDFRADSDVPAALRGRYEGEPNKVIRDAVDLPAKEFEKDERFRSAIRKLQGYLLGEAVRDNLATKQEWTSGLITVLVLAAIPISTHQVTKPVAVTRQLVEHLVSSPILSVGDLLALDPESRSERREELVGRVSRIQEAWKRMPSPQLIDAEMRIGRTLAELEWMVGQPSAARAHLARVRQLELDHEGSGRPATQLRALEMRLHPSGFGLPSTKSVVAEAENAREVIEELQALKLPDVALLRGRAQRLIGDACLMSGDWSRAREAFVASRRALETLDVEEAPAAWTEYARGLHGSKLAAGPGRRDASVREFARMADRTPLDPRPRGLWAIAELHSLREETTAAATSLADPEVRVGLASRLRKATSAIEALLMQLPLNHELREGAVEARRLRGRAARWTEADWDEASELWLAILHAHGARESSASLTAAALQSVSDLIASRLLHIESFGDLEWHLIDTGLKLAHGELAPREGVGEALKHAWERRPATEPEFLRMPRGMSDHPGLTRGGAIDTEVLARCPGAVVKLLVAAAIIEEHMKDAKRATHHMKLAEEVARRTNLNWKSNAEGDDLSRLLHRQAELGARGRAPGSRESPIPQYKEGR